MEYARERRTFGRPLATRQAIQWPLAELQTEVELVRGLVRKTAGELDRVAHLRISDKVSMCNYRANRLVCDAADRAMHDGLGYSRHTPFEHIHRHHRRYRITEGSEEVQMRKVAAYLFGFAGPGKSARRSDALEEGGVGLAAALTHGLQAVLATGAPQLVEQLGGQDDPGGAERVAQRDRAAVDVRLVQ